MFGHIHEERRAPDGVYDVWRRARRAARDHGGLTIGAVRGPEWGGRLLVIHERDLEVLIACSGPGA